MVQDFKKLEIWSEASGLALTLYASTKKFPKEELFALTSQIRRAVVSITSNIAEGSGRNSKKDFNNFLGIAHGSSCELETQTIIAERIGFIDREILTSIQKDILEIQKMNWALKRSMTD